MYSYYPNKDEVREYIKDAMLDLKIAFSGLFKSHEYELAEKVFEALDALSVALSDLGETQNVWITMKLDEEIPKLLSDSKNLIAEAQQIAEDK